MKRITLGELCHPNARQLKANEETMIDYIDIASVDNVSKKIKGFQTMPFGEAPSRARKSVQNGSILVSTVRPNLNAVAILEEGTPNISVASTGFCILDCKDSTDKRFVFNFCKSKRFVNDMVSQATGASYPAVNDKIVRNSLVPAYSYEEQCRIGQILDKVSTLIETRTQELKSLDDLIKARFVELFGDININDKHWECEPLGELCTIVRGGSPRPIEQYLGGDVPWIKIGDATVGDNIYLSSTKEHIIQEGVKKSRLVKAGSLIFANCGVSLGFARIITFDGCIHDGWLAMEDIDERLNKVFLLQTLNQMTEHFRAIAPAGTQPNLNTGIMKVYRQVIPPIELQRDFIRFAEQVDKSKATVQKALDETQLLFDSLMQQYFG